MLIDVDTGRKIHKVPYKETYDLTKRMSADEMDAVFVELNSRISGKEIHTAGWMPGPDWSDTPFQPIYEKAAKRNFDLAARLFGLIVWKVFLDREETWITGRFEKDGEPIGSRTYFQPRT